MTHQFDREPLLARSLTIREAILLFGAVVCGVFIAVHVAVQVLT